MIYLIYIIIILKIFIATCKVMIIYGKKSSSHFRKFSYSIIAARYRLDGSAIESQGGLDFPHRPNRRWGPPSLQYSGYRVPFLGLKRSGRGVNLPPPSSAKVKGRLELYLYFPSEPSWPLSRRTLSLPCCILHMSLLLSIKLQIFRTLHYICFFLRG